MEKTLTLAHPLLAVKSTLRHVQPIAIAKRETFRAKIEITIANCTLRNNFGFRVYMKGTCNTFLLYSRTFFPKVV